MTKTQYHRFLAVAITLFVAMLVMSIIWFNPIFIAVCVNVAGIILLTRFSYNRRNRPVDAQV